MTVHVVSTVAGLEAAVQAGAANPGDEIHLRQGDYLLATAGLNSGSNNPGKGVVQPAITGNYNNRITIRSYPGEWARIRGGVELWAMQTGGYLTFRNLEIAPTPTTRVFDTAGDVDIPNLFGGEAPYIRLLDCYLHDGLDVFPMPLTGGNWEVHGNLIANTGYYSRDQARNRDYNIYTHNSGTPDRGPISIKRNCFVSPFGSWGTCLWSATDVNVQDYTVEENIYLEAAHILAGASGMIRNNVFQKNHAYSVSNYLILDGGKNLRLGNGDQGNTLDVNVLDNYWVTRDSAVLALLYQRQCNVQRNTFIHLLDTPSNYHSVSWYASAFADLGIVIDNNHYHHAGNQSRFAWDDGAYAYRTFAQWQAINGWDARSSYTSAMPSSNVVVVLPSEYSDLHRGRAFVAIYNWEGLDTIQVNLSRAGLEDNAPCILRNCANYDEHPIYFRYYADNPVISVPMRDPINNYPAFSMGLPAAYDSPVPWYANPYPNFCCFLVEQIGAAKSMDRSRLRRGVPAIGRY